MRDDRLADTLSPLGALAMRLMVYAAAGLVLIIGLWWVGWLALVVTGAEPQGSIVTAAARVAAAIGVTGLVWVLIVDVSLGWGVCALTHCVRSDQEDETWPP